MAGKTRAEEFKTGKIAGEKYISEIQFKIKYTIFSTALKLNIYLFFTSFFTWKKLVLY
jgi:hypothetical protein